MLIARLVLKYRESHSLHIMISCTHTASETLFASCLDWKTTLSDKSGQDQTSGCVNRRFWIGFPRVNGHDRSAQAGDPIQTRRDAGASSSIRGRKHFGSTTCGERKHLASYSPSNFNRLKSFTTKRGKTPGKRNGKNILGI